MNSNLNKNYLQKIVALAGVVSASVLFSLPTLAQTPSNSGDMNQPLNNTNSQTDSTMRNRQSSDQSMSDNDVYSICGGYEGNPTSGGGYYCAMERQRMQYPNRQASKPGDNTQSQTSRPERSNIDNSPSTTGAGYPGNNVRPQGVDKSLNRESYNPDSNSYSESKAESRKEMFDASERGFYNEMTGEYYNPGENVKDP